MLLLPTGVGGVLYRPRFFNLSVAFNRELWGHTLRADDLTFRLATLANAVPVYTACVHGDFKDNKLITRCPALSGVSFQHLARRRLQGPTLSPQSAAVADTAHYGRDGGKGRHEEHGREAGTQQLRGRSGHQPLQHTQLQVEEDAGREQRRASAHSGGGASGGYSLFRSRRRGSSSSERPSSSTNSWYRNLYSGPIVSSNIGDAGAANKSLVEGLVSESVAGGHNGSTAMGSNSSRSDVGVSAGQSEGSLHRPAEKQAVLAPAVYNRSRLLVIGSLRPPAKNIDHGKQGSLSSINSKHDGNFHQWNKATEFLRRKGLFDVDAMLQRYVRRERGPCVATTLLLGYDNSTWVGSVVGALATSVQALHEGWTDKRCGIVTC
jgi:hypothetical protein